MTKLSRRDFMKTATLMGGVSLFAGCSFFQDSGHVPQYIKGAPNSDPLESLRGIKNLFTVCALCEGKCGISCRVAQGAVVKIGGNPYHPISKGDPLPFHTQIDQASTIGASVCAVGSSGIQTLYDPFRIAKPLKRIGERGSGKWKSVTWDEALTEIINGGNLFGEGMVPGIKVSLNSKEGLGFLVGQADWGALTYIKSFLSSFAGSELYRDEAVLYEEMVRASNESVFGKGYASVSANYNKARCLVNFGAAPLDSGIPLVSVAREIANARASSPSLKWVVVDPRQSTSGSKADIWLPIIPGRDLSFALAVMKALFDRFPQAIRFSKDSINGIVKEHSIAEYAENAGSYEAAAIEVARYIAEAGPDSAIIPGSGVYTQQNGKKVAEAILSINLLVGSLPGRGGLTHSDHSFFEEAERRFLGASEKNFSQSKLAAPCSSLILWSADPTYCTPSFGPLLSNTKNFPLVVAIDHTITETAALADYILPDTTYLERWDICLAPFSSSYDGFGLRSPMVGGIDCSNGRYFPILPETMLMEDVLFKLSQSLGLDFGKELIIKDTPSIAKSFYHKLASDLSDSFAGTDMANDSKSVTIEKMFERGGYFKKCNRQEGKYNTEPANGVNPSEWEKTIEHKETLGDDLLILITYTLPFNRPTVACVNPWVLETLPENRLIINPIDAHLRKIRQGDMVSIESSDGSIKKSVKIQIAPGIKPGVVALAKGFGYKGAGASRYSIEKDLNFFDKTRGAGVNPAEFIGKGSRVRIIKA